jgi:hypothetical protein
VFVIPPLQELPWGAHELAQLPETPVPLFAQAFVQHCALPVHDEPMMPQMLPSPGGPESGGPESGGPVSGQHCGAGPQLSVQFPVQPACAQHVFPGVQTAPPAQLQGCRTPQLSATDTLH